MAVSLNPNGLTLGNTTVGDWADAGGGSPPTISVFENSGTWNKPSGCTKVKVFVTGGGGGGGTSRVNPSNTGRNTTAGGSAGGTAIEYIDVTNTNSVTVTIGNGGTGNWGYGGVYGNAGGASSFGAFCSANGGGGGAGYVHNNTAATITTNSGGNGVGGNLNIEGQSGIFGYIDNSFTQRAPGTGGASFWGGGAEGSVADSGSPPTPVAYGAGGGGASGGGGTDQRGGTGAKGVVVVEEFYG